MNKKRTTDTPEDIEAVFAQILAHPNPGKAAVSLLNELVRSLVASGRISPKGKTADHLELEALEVLGRVRRAGGPIRFRVDYTPAILKHARSFVRSKRPELACVLYAIWFEHRINEILAQAAGRRGIKDEDITQMIRRARFRDKVTQLWRSLGLRNFAQAHTKRILDLMERRNEFVHYKWKASEMQGQVIGEEFRKVLDGIETCVDYVREYQRRVIYGDLRAKNLPGSEERAKAINELVKQLRAGKRVRPAPTTPTGK
jgi:hypothetical protein